jgi:capsid protein
MSLSDVQRSLGFIPREVMEELEKDIADAREKGLSLSVDGGASQALEEDPEERESEARPRE